MRKRGENSVKPAGKPAIPPDDNNDFTLGVESQSFHLAAFLLGRLYQRLSKQ
jgi:hypothetical protein